MANLDLVGENARAYLERLLRGDLATLLLPTSINYHETLFGSEQDAVVVVCAPPPFDEALECLPPFDRKRVAEAILSNTSLRVPDDISRKRVGDPLSGLGAFVADLIIHRNMMVSVATGQKSIQDVDDYYIARQVRLLEFCAATGVTYENPHDSLWDWFRYWKAQGMDTYSDRREYVRKLFATPIATAVSRVSNPSPIGEREPTGWERVDRSISRAKAQLPTAATEEERQAIGLLCREALISLAQAVYDPAIHATTDDAGVKIGATDAKRQLFAWLHCEMPGGDNKKISAHIKAAIELAVHLQHRRTATRTMTALCVEATSSAVAVVAIVAGKTAVT